jgi:very-short-patch-repair endonuclease
MSKISEKIKEQIIEDLMPTLQAYRDAGVNNTRIQAMVDRHIKNRTRKFYENKKKLGDVLIEHLDDLRKRCSEAEAAFYHLLVDAGVDFKFQYPIEPYLIDYFVPEDLVVELVGPLHGTEKQKLNDKKRDAYLEKLGYRIFRIPITVVAMDKDAVITEIKMAAAGIT